MKRRSEQWERVESSCVHRLRYHQQRRTLDLEFPDGGRYEYLDVSPAEYRRLKHADSVGRYVNQQIKKHRFRRLDADNG